MALQMPALISCPTTPTTPSDPSPCCTAITRSATLCHGLSKPISFQTGPVMQAVVGRIQDADGLRQHPDLWFEDGSVVMCAETTLFRVHISQLSRHSVCFRDMFAIPQPKRDTGTAIACTRTERSDGNEGSLLLKEYHNCPLVHLHDSAEDLANLLTALYDGPNFGNNDQDDFRIVSGILRLSTKYIIDSLRTKAVAHLSIAWPSTLRAWDAREDLARTHEMEAAWSTPRYPSSIAVINLAREVDEPSLLPSAFYDLSRYSFSQIFEPTEDEPLSTHLTSASSGLSLSDLQKLTLGKEASHSAITSLIRSMGYLRQSQTPQHHTSHATANMRGHSRKPSLSAARGVCVSAGACRKEFSELVDLATQHYLFDRERGYTDPLYVAEELGQLKGGGTDFCECKPCATQLEMWATRERERLWKLVPSWFRLEGSEGGAK